MTIPALANEITYDGDGVTVNFGVPFQFDTAADLKVFVTDTVTGAVQPLSSGFSVIGTNVVFVSAPSGTTKVTILDDPALTQPTDYVSLDAFPAESHERALDRVTRLCKRLHQQWVRTLRLADGDLVTDGAITSTVNRRGKYLFFNTITGAVEYATSVIGQTLSQSVIAQFLNPQTAAEIAAGITPVNFSFPSGDVRRYGADATGVADSFTAFQNALKGVGTYGRVIVPAGQYSLASISLPLIVQADYQSIQAQGDAVLTVTGSSGAYTTVIDCVNRNGLTVSGLSFVGNSQADSIGKGAAIQWRNLNSSVALDGFTVRNCSFRNFKADYWILVSNNGGGTATMTKVSICNNNFTSQSGNSRTPALLTEDSACIGIAGSGTSLAGTIQGIEIANNIAEGDYIKSFVVCYQSTRYIEIIGNQAQRFGTSGITADCGAYAIMLYDSSGFQPPSRYNISGNLITSPFSCGLYLANTNQGVVSGNTITGQTDTADGTLPKGAIAINGGQEISVTGNNLYNCYRSISISSGASNVDLKSNKLDSTQNNSIGVKLNNGVGGLTHIDITANSMNMTGTNCQGVYIQSFTGGGNLFDQIHIGNNKISCSQYCIQVTTGDASHNGQNLRIMGNKLNANLQHISCTGYTTAITVANNVFSGAPTADGCDLSSSTKLSLIGNSFEDFTSGYALKLNGAQGELWGNSFVRCSGGLIDSGGGGEILGTVVPTWTGVAGMKVQTGYSGEGGAGGSKYLIIGWIYSGAGWLPMRVLDGN